MGETGRTRNYAGSRPRIHSLHGLNTLITGLIAGMFVPVSFGYFGIAGSSFSFQIDLITLLVGAGGILVAHELIHVLCIPDFIRSDTTSMGITYGGGFVYTEEQLTRTRLIIISFAPVITISLILPFIPGMLNLLSPVLLGILLLNSLGSSVDILIALLIQVPSRSHLRANGRETYWKMDEGARHRIRRYIPRETGSPGGFVVPGLPFSLHARENGNNRI